MKQKRVLIIAGGTGGHIFPALAVARALREDGFDLRWLGSRVGMEGKLVGDEFPISYVSIKAIRGKSIFSKLLSPFRLGIATWQALRILKKLKPDIVLGMGGFVSAPGGLAARLTKTPLVIHEQNAIAGFTNRLLSKHAQKVLQGFPHAFPLKISAVTIGNPVRPNIASIPPPQERLKDRDGPLRILVIGGSQGARVVNQMMVRVLSRYTKEAAMLRIWHQTGRLDFQGIQHAYSKLNVQATVEAFIDKMPEAYAWADLLICRSGALTVSEIAAVGLPSILIPFPYAVDDHQYANGNYLAGVGAAELIRQSDLTDDRLHTLILDYAKDRPRLIDMAEKARSLAKPEALSAMVNVCQELTKKNQ